MRLDKMGRADILRIFHENIECFSSNDAFPANSIQLIFYFMVILCDIFFAFLSN